jgi:hypothetical protein
MTASARPVAPAGQAPPVGHYSIAAAARSRQLSSSSASDMIRFMCSIVSSASVPPRADPPLRFPNQSLAPVPPPVDIAGSVCLPFLLFDCHSNPLFILILRVRVESARRRARHAPTMRESLSFARHQVRAHHLVQVTLSDVATTKHVAHAAAFGHCLMQTHAAVRAAQVEVTYLPD